MCEAKSFNSTFTITNTVYRLCTDIIIIITITATPSGEHVRLHRRRCHDFMRDAVPMHREYQRRKSFRIQNGIYTLSCHFLFTLGTFGSRSSATRIQLPERTKKCNESNENVVKFWCKNFQFFMRCECVKANMTHRLLNVERAEKHIIVEHSERVNEPINQRVVAR